MSRWHRENPELVGTDADPWTIHEDYRKALPHRSVIRPSEDEPEFITLGRQELEQEDLEREQEWLENIDTGVEEWPPR